MREMKKATELLNKDMVTNTGTKVGQIENIVFDEKTGDLQSFVINLSEQVTPGELPDSVSRKNGKNHVPAELVKNSQHQVILQTK